MHIYLDESGVFVGLGQKATISTMAALVVPDARLKRLELDWRRLRRTLPMDRRGEVKGKDLSEYQVSEVSNLLFRHKCICEVNFIDLGIHTVEDIQVHKLRQIDLMAVNLTDKHSENVWAGVRRWQDTLSSMNNQQYIQSVVIFDLLRRVLDNAMLYYVLRNPRELGNFSWIFDAKGDDNEKNKWEKWCVDVLGPFLQASSLRIPGSLLEGANYKYFDRKFLMDEWPKHLPRRVENSAAPMYLNKIFSDLKYSSDIEAGLELADIAANAARRLIKGRLQSSCWAQFSKLFVLRKGYCLQPISMNGITRSKVGYSNLLRQFGSGSRPMFPDHIRRQIDAEHG